MMTNTSPQHLMSLEEMQRALEPLLRRIVREEVLRVAQEWPQTFYLTPGMPLYEDMAELARRSAANDIELLSHDEVWHEPVPAEV